MRVDRVYTRDVVRIDESSSLEDAAYLMQQHHVGTLLVTGIAPNDSQVIGIVTDRDLVLQAMTKALKADETPVSEVMTRGIVTVAARADVHEAMELMRAGGLRRLAVTDRDGAVVGVLSLDDIIDGVAADLTALAAVIRSERQREVAPASMIAQL